MKTVYNGKTVGDYEVSNRGISRIISVDDMGGYTSTLVMSKEAFIEAYNKYIKTDKEGCRVTNEEAKEIIIKEKDSLKANPMVEVEDRLYEAFDVAIKALEQKAVLDKIKAEILDEAEYAYADFDGYKEDVLHAEPDELPYDDFRYGMERAVEIINKYKAQVTDINIGKIAESGDKE